MKNPLSVFERPQVNYLSITVAVFALMLFSALSSYAYESAFRLKIYDNKNVPKFILYNDSRDHITKFSITIGNIDKSFDYGDSDPKPTERDSGFGDVATYNVDIAPNNTFGFKLDVDNNNSGKVLDYREVFFNNGDDKLNSKVTVWTDQGGESVSAEVTMPDDIEKEEYWIYSKNRPGSLVVSSLTEVVDDEYPDLAEYIARCTVKINDVAVSRSVGKEESFSAYKGDRIEISAPQTVYYDADSEYLTDSTKNEADKIKNDAREKFDGIGISIDDDPQTGDPTLYRFTFEESCEVTLKWHHYYALRMEQDFLLTESTLRDEAGNPWAGPVESMALGDPDPEITLHWIEKGGLVIGQIDGQVMDFTHPGLDIRYVPVGYSVCTDFDGDLGTLETRNYSFLVGQSPPLRQQIQEFAMTRPASFKYKWRIQYGIRVNVDGPEHAALPIVRAKNWIGVYETAYVGEGVFWFYPGKNVQIMSAANEGASSSHALTGWSNGDGYYLGAVGEVDTVDGSLVDDISLVNGIWIESLPVTDSNSEVRTYRGIQISGEGLLRPVRTTWHYGNQAFEVTVPIGKYVFQQPMTVGERVYDGTTFLQEPSVIQKSSVSGIYQEVSDADMTVWDAVSAKLYPVVPGMFRVTWPSPDVAGQNIDVMVTAEYPAKAHYPHITSSPPVALDPDPDDNFIFEAIKYNETLASVDSTGSFESSNPGHVVLLFKEIDNSGRIGPQEYVRVRVVNSLAWNDTAALQPARTAIIGSRIADELDRANLKTGFLLFDAARYNPFVYDSSKLESIAAVSIYDMELLASTSQEKKVINPDNLPGPIIPVNLHPGANENEKIVIAWYDDPAENDGLLWPYATRVYNPRWPVSPAEGLGRIVIASQYGSESVGNDLQDQIVVEAITNTVSDGAGGTVLSIVPAETTYNPSRIQQSIIYRQPNRDTAGYNPNEEHALMAPSLRFAQVSPRPSAAYALRDNDLNIYNKFSSVEAGQPVDYTSHPFVLTQFYDAEAEEFKMRVYTVMATVPEIEGYTFANSALWDGATPTALRLRNEPNVRMVAGEPVIPFYPLGVVIGAVSPPEAFGKNITAQLTYWEDHKNTSWSVSGGENAWFAVSPFYPLLPDFWWEDDKPGRIVTDEDDVRITAIPNVGDSLAFLPNDIDEFENYSIGGDVDDVLDRDATPTEILYRSDWPDVVPILKSGETLTFSGGEYRADHPTTITLDADNNLQTVETPGLPEVLAFAAAEIVFDSLNPKGEDAKWVSDWTARVGQVLEKRSVDLLVGNFPPKLSPASGLTRISQGKYIFSELPASLQKRVRYDPINGKLEIFGLVNDKDIGEDTLTAPPPAVYVLEPNILTDEDVKALKDLDDSSSWADKIDELQILTLNPNVITGMSEDYLVGLERKIVRDEESNLPLYEQPETVPPVIQRIPYKAAPLRAFGPGLAVVPNADFLDPEASVPDISWITLVENNDPSLGGSPVTPHIIKVDRRERYRGAIKTVLSDNVFDENIVLRHQGDFGANADKLVFEWWYRPDDGRLNVPPPDLIEPGKSNPWMLFPDLSGSQGVGRFEVMLKGNPNAPEALLADTWWYCRYRHENDKIDGTDWGEDDERVNFTWAGAGNSDPFNDFDLDGLMDFKPQLAMGWIKRVLDAVNPYEARIRDFEGESPATVSSMLQQFGPRYEGPVALNPDKNVIENVGLIALYQTILNRGKALSINLSRPVSTPAIANALQLASTRLSDFYTLLANEAYSDAQDPTVGIGSDSVDLGSLSPTIFAFQNQLATLMDEELGMLRGLDDGFARPVYNRLFWNFTKGEGEAAYALNYNVSDINMDGFIDEDDAMILYPQGHGDAWGHYLTATRMQYNLLKHPYFNWVSRSEFYNLMDIVLKVDFLDERKFAQMAAAKAKAGADVVNLSYREKFVKDPTAQWQGYRDSNPDRAWGVEGWSRRAAQGAFFDWVTANALLPSVHPNEELEGIQKVDRTSNADISVISANMNKVQSTFDQANNGYNPLGLSKDSIVFDIDPTFMEVGSGMQGEMHFDQLFSRAEAALENLRSTWNSANEARNRVRAIANTEAEFRNNIYQEDLSYRNQLIELFGKPYEGTIGSGQLYPAGYDGPDLALYMYVDVREINDATVPGPTLDFATFTGNSLSSGTMRDAYDDLFTDDFLLFGFSLFSDDNELQTDLTSTFAPTFAPDANGVSDVEARDGLYALNYTTLSDPRVELDNFTSLMPVSAKGYTFQAPASWGNRLVSGRLQSLVNQMIRQEAAVAEAVAAWDGKAGEIIRTMRIIEARVATSDSIANRNEDFERSRYIINTIINGIILAVESLESGKKMATITSDALQEATPLNLPMVGLAVSPGDALSPLRSAIDFGKLAFTTTFDWAQIGLNTTRLIQSTAFEIAEKEVGLANDSAERELAKKEWLKDLEDLVGDEPVLRISLFKEIEALRGLSEQYRALLDEGSRLIDERTAFNKRVAAATQLNRYQDMTFRVSRNHALQNYRSSFDLTARYVYLAAKAYDYETSLDDANAASPQGAMKKIVKARSAGDLSGQLGWLKTNYDALEGQLGVNNPQSEFGKISLRTEKFRIYPKDSIQGSHPGAESSGSPANYLWKQKLQSMRVDNLWEVSEFRQYCRPFDIMPEDGSEPGIVIRFGTDIKAGENFFGHLLSGGDHSYDPSVYATKIRAAGIWFSDYQSESLEQDLPEAPRVYLFPAGMDMLSISTSGDPTQTRYWNVVDQRIPVPIASIGSELDQSDWVPVFDSLNGVYGEERRFSSFRAYHDGSDEINDDELIYNSRLVGRSVRNTQWVLIIPGRTLNADPNVGLDRFIDQVSDIKLVFETYGYSGN